MVADVLVDLGVPDADSAHGLHELVQVLLQQLQRLPQSIPQLPHVGLVVPAQQRAAPEALCGCAKIPSLCHAARRACAAPQRLPESLAQLPHIGLAVPAQLSAAPEALCGCMERHLLCHAACRACAVPRPPHSFDWVWQTMHVGAALQVWCMHATGILKGVSAPMRCLSV